MRQNPDELEGLEMIIEMIVVIIEIMIDYKVVQYIYVQ